MPCVHRARGRQLPALVLRCARASGKRKVLLRASSQPFLSHRAIECSDCKVISTGGGAHIRDFSVRLWRQLLGMGSLFDGYWVFSAVKGSQLLGTSCGSG